MPLFNEKVVSSALHAFDMATGGDAQAAAAEWAARASDVAFDLQNESNLEQEFNRILIQRALGYIARAPGVTGTMQVKQAVPGGTIVDVALGTFDDGETSIVAPLELKGPRVPLDRIMPGRAKTPVQQAWDYAMDAPGAKWVLVSNMKELRLYAFGHGRQLYESFDLKKIGNPQEFARLRLLLAPAQLLGGTTAALLAQSAQADRNVTNQLYVDYKSLRSNLISFVADQHPAIGVEARIRTVQTLRDRVLFIAFAEDKNLLPKRSLGEALAEPDRFFPVPKWERVRKLFEWVDKGAPPENIPRYNGGLFAADPLIDGLNLPDHLVEQFNSIADYDFASEVSVTILGHIFEQSITDIENEKAAAQLAAPPPSASKKKREGVVYTPDFITRFIVEQTIGKHLDEIGEALLPAYGRRENDGAIHWRNKSAAEADYWTAYLDKLARLRILDPACGSGAFLIAAFNFLNADQKRVRDRLSELQPGILTHLSPNADVEIITNNLFGVDVNAESVEITKLALWLQTARRERALESLDGNIKHGNSLVESAEFHSRPFDWNTLGGLGSFDIVLGNPPYVRMELLKDIKPHLEARFAVASDRADLYAYFFELGVGLLAPGGRLGFISSSTFFRTGSGAPLRSYLASQTQVEAVVDFGDLQVFEGVTTYPAIVILRKGGAADDGTLTYLNARALPDDLSRVFDQQSLTMPRDRLGSGTWRFESDLLDTIRAKMAAGRKTLAETYGAPLYGIKTGLNDAFILTRAQRDAIVERDPRSADLLKPFLIGENLKRWHVESDDLWLIYTPKNRIDIEDYPAIRAHLLPWRERLEGRATRQNWWELQQAQAAYAPHFSAPKVIWPHFQNRASFCAEVEPHFLNNKCFFWPGARPELSAFLNSRACWFGLQSIARAKRGGYLEAEAQYVGALPIPSNIEELGKLGTTAQDASHALAKLRLSGRHRLSDLAPSVNGIDAFLDWPLLTFAELQDLLKKRCKTVIPIAERDEWELWFTDRKAEAAKLASAIAAAEAEIDQLVYRLFDLTPTEIAAVEDALALASPSLSLKAYEAISAVEGLHLSDEARAQLTAEGSTSERREQVSRAHAA